jgi:D-aspartate ligase
VTAPAFLTDGWFYGTLAAARALRREGVPVWVGDPSARAPARWSRGVRALSCPPVADGEAFLAWLVGLGERRPGLVLLATSDAAAALYARHQATLRRSFRLAAPPAEGLERLLDKERLHAAAAAAGLDVPDAWFPRDLGALEEALPGIRFPVLVKARSHAAGQVPVKATRAVDAGSLRAAFGEAHRAAGAPPIVQADLSGAALEQVAVAGYVDRRGRGVFRCARKVLQVPRRAGIGVCFEPEPLRADLRERVLRLCVEAGYHGVVEVELLRAGGRERLIDVNPRFYHEMALDLARGLPLPQLAYAEAVGDAARVDALLARAANGPERAFCHRSKLALLLAAGRVAGSLGAAETERWRAWRRAHAAAVDPVLDGADWLPAVADLAGQLWAAGRHPRAFLRAAGD